MQQENIGAKTSQLSTVQLTNFFFNFRLAAKRLINLERPNPNTEVWELLHQPEVKLLKHCEKK